MNCVVFTHYVEAPFAKLINQRNLLKDQHNNTFARTTLAEQSTLAWLVRNCSPCFWMLLLLQLLVLLLVACF